MITSRLIEQISQFDGSTESAAEGQDPGLDGKNPICIAVASVASCSNLDGRSSIQHRSHVEVRLLAKVMRAREG